MKENLSDIPLFLKAVGDTIKSSPYLKGKRVKFLPLQWKPPRIIMHLNNEKVFNLNYVGVL